MQGGIRRVVLMVRIPCAAEPIQIVADPNDPDVQDPYCIGCKIEFSRTSELSAGQDFSVLWKLVLHRTFVYLLLPSVQVIAPK
jgi:hypothetical protein